MTAPGNHALIFSLLALFVACSGYAAGRIHQRYRTDEDREEAYRHGYDTATRSVFTLAARIIAPRRSAARGSAKVKNALGEVTTKSLRNADPPDGSTAAAEGVAPAGAKVPRGVSADLRSFARSALSWGGFGGSAAAPAEGDPGESNLGFARSASVKPDAAAPSRAASGRTKPGSGELGFPAPPPPSPRTVAEPAAVGGLIFQPFPDPRPADDFSSVLDFADDGPDPTHTPYTDLDGAAAVSDEAGEQRPRVDSWLAAKERADAGSRLSAEEVLRAAGRPVADRPKPAEPTAGGATPAERSAGHRAFDGESDPTAHPGDQDDSAGGRHTVPDELVRAATYRLPPDRVFRAKVPDTAKPPAASDDDPAPRSVPKPRQS